MGPIVMRFDPTGRLSKYDSVRKQLELVGHKVTIHVDRDLVDAMTVRSRHDESQCVMVLRRKRGWFIGDNPWRLYEVANGANLVTVIERSLTSFPRTIETAAALGLKAVLLESWARDEQLENKMRWEQHGWMELSEDEVSAVAERYESSFWQEDKLVLPLPCVTWRLVEPLNSRVEDLEVLEADLCTKTLHAFKMATAPGARLFALDWQHDCFTLDPHRIVDKPFRDYWAIPILSDGEDYIYLDESFDFGLVSLRDLTFSVFGESIVALFLNDPPKILESAVKLDILP